MAAIERGMEDGVVLSIIQKVATKRGVEPTELPPLSETIDTDALTALFENSSKNNLCIKFEYCGHIFTINDSDNIAVERQT